MLQTEVANGLRQFAQSSVSLEEFVHPYLAHTRGNIAEGAIAEGLANQLAAIENERSRRMNWTGKTDVIKIRLD